MTETATEPTTAEPIEPTPDYSVVLEQIRLELAKMNDVQAQELQRQAEQREAEAKAEAEAEPNTFESDLLAKLDGMEKQEAENLKQFLTALDNTSEVAYQEDQKLFQTEQKEMMITGLEFIVILMGLIIGFFVSKSFIKGLIPSDSR